MLFYYFFAFLLTTWASPPVHLLWLFLKGWPSAMILPISASQVVRITGVSQQHPAVEYVQDQRSWWLAQGWPARECCPVSEEAPWHFHNDIILFLAHYTLIYFIEVCASQISALLFILLYNHICGGEGGTWYPTIFTWKYMESIFMNRILSP
jgi:hypothetical protein